MTTVNDKTTRMIAQRGNYAGCLHDLHGNMIRSIYSTHLVTSLWTENRDGPTN